MARTQQDILEQINETANQHTELAELQSNTSRVSAWGYIKQTLAFAIRSLEELFDHHQQEIKHLIENQQIGSLQWYKTQALKWQKGDKLSLRDHRPAYLKDNPGARLITHAAVEEGTGNDKGSVLIKVVKAKTGASADAPYTPLSEEERSAFQGYLNAITFAGIRLTASTGEAVAIQVAAKIQVDAQLMNADGTAVGSTDKPVEQAIKAYLRDLPFNGIIRKTALVDAIQAVPGVLDVLITSLKHPNDAGDDVEAFVATHQPASGHATLGTDTSLSYQITLITS